MNKNDNYHFEVVISNSKRPRILDLRSLNSKESVLSDVYSAIRKCK